MRKLWFEIRYDYYTAVMRLLAWRTNRLIRKKNRVWGQYERALSCRIDLELDEKKRTGSCGKNY